MMSLVATRAPIEMGNKYHRDRRTILLSSRLELSRFSAAFAAVRVRWRLRSAKFLGPARE
jgi:hypothetical protein